MPTTGAKNQPIVQNTDTFNPVADINTLANWVATNYANFKVLTGSTVRTSLTGADLFVGLVVWEQSTGLFWQYNGTAWIALSLGAVPRAELTKTAAQSIPNNSSTTVTGWTTTQARNITVNNTAGSVTVPYAGNYNLWAQIVYTTNATGSRFVIVAVNGSVVSRLGLTAPTTTASAQMMPIAITSLALAANDVITIQALQVSGGALDVIGTTKLVVEYVGA
jgi:hypothetical protein